MPNPDSNSEGDVTPLDPRRIQAALAQANIGWRVDYAAAMPSTMLAAHSAAHNAAEGAADDYTHTHGLVVLTEEQTAGRGRRGRGWHAPPGRGLLMSVLLASPDLAFQLPHLPMLAGLAAQAAIQAAIQAVSSARIGLKWPNDLVWCPDPADPTRVEKLGGILVESVYCGSEPGHETGHTTGNAAGNTAEHMANQARPYAVLGVGINVNQRAGELPPVRPPALPPTSLRLITGDTVDRTDLAIGVCRSLARELTRLGRAAPQAVAALLRDWRQQLVLMGQPIQVYPTQGEAYAATAHAVTPQGELIVIDTQGARHLLLADEVSIRPAHVP